MTSVIHVKMTLSSLVRPVKTISSVTRTPATMSVLRVYMEKIEQGHVSLVMNLVLSVSGLQEKNAMTVFPSNTF